MRIRLTRFLQRSTLVVLLLAILGLVATTAVTAADPAITTGFIRSGLDTGHGPGELTDFTFLPDASGTITRSALTIGKSGGVRYIAGSGASRQIGQIPNIVSIGDLGLISISLSPNYLMTGQIALLGTYNAAPHPVGQLDIYTVNNPTNPTSLTHTKTVLGGITQNDGQDPPGASHGPGTVIWANDGTLFTGFGDGANFVAVDPLALRALDPDDPHGKIFHTDVNGRGVAGNPYYGKAPAGSWREAMFASGFRNQFRFSQDPARSNTLFVGDVGWQSYEKLIVVTAGTVGGWPCYEGVDGTGGIKTPGYVDLQQCQDYYRANQIDYKGTTTPKEIIPGPTTSLWNYDRSGKMAAIVGGATYTGTSYPAAYQGAYFFGNFPVDSPSLLWTIKTDGTKLTRQPETDGFAKSIGGPSAIHTGPGGDIYYSDVYDGTIWQIQYTPGNRAPEVQVTTTSTPATKTVCFDASKSIDLDGDSYTVGYAFGDGTSGSGLTACHTYPNATATTIYKAVVTVTDSAGAKSSKTVTVVPADNPPTIVPVTAPTTAQKFAVGQAINFSLRIGDIEDGPRPVRQQTSMLHCESATECHTHPGAAVTLTPNTSGIVNYSTTFEDHGQNTAQIIRFTATDLLGLETTYTYQANPDLRTITVTSSAPATINGKVMTTSFAAVGSVNSVSVPATSDYMVFTRWSDGGARAHNFTMPATNLSLTATFSTAIDAYSATLAGKMGLATGIETTIGNGRVRTYQNGSIYWSATTGAREVMNRMLPTYIQSGGPAGVLGFPITGELDASPGGRMNTFQNGYIVWSAATGAHEMHGAIRYKYDALGGSTGPLGFPVSSEVDAVPGGRFNSFQGGFIVWSPSTGAHEVVGAIKDTYNALGGSTSALGFPVTGELDAAPGGRMNTFQNGYIVWSPSTGAREVRGTIRAKYDQLGGSTGRLGFPTSNQVPAAPGGQFNSFQGGFIVWSPSTGAHEVVGAIKDKYNQLGGSTSALGFPISGEGPASPGGRMNTFQNGYIVWSPATGAHEVRGAIRAKYDQLGGSTGIMGFPTSDEFAIPGGARNNFQYGHYIEWRPGIGYTVK
jgi:uncharacterized protein with LGFP repeats